MHTASIESQRANIKLIIIITIIIKKGKRAKKKIQLRKLSSNTIM